MNWEWVVLLLGFSYLVLAFYLVETLRRKWGVE